MDKFENQQKPPLTHDLAADKLIFYLHVCVSENIVSRYMTLPPGSMGMYDPTEIRNRGMLLRFQKEAFIKVGYHLVVFFVLLYW